MDRVALKIQRRRSPRTALNEIGILKAVQRHGPCASIVALLEVFLYDGHVCMAYEMHGRALEDEIQARRLTPLQTLRVTEQIFHALTHLHAAGFAHTDLKPANILYDRRRGIAKLADLGNAEGELATGTSLCTREYTPPEVLLGAPLTKAIDHWSLGCTVFEMLTGETLFDPRAMAAAKYREFYFEDEGVSEATPDAVAEDNAAEEAEQYRPGDVIAEKYRLEKELGRGRFGTVWAAEVIGNQSLDGSYETIVRHCRAHAAGREVRSAAQQRARSWKKTKGADDMRDLALNYEHLLLIDGICGPLPRALVRAGTYRNSFFTAKGTFCFPATIAPDSVESRLKASGLPAAEVRRFTKLIGTLCHIDPSQRTLLPGGVWAPARAGRRSGPARRQGLTLQ